jgi:hypothetical protein
VALRFALCFAPGNALCILVISLAAHTRRDTPKAASATAVPITAARRCAPSDAASKHQPSPLQLLAARPAGHDLGARDPRMAEVGTVRRLQQSATGWRRLTCPHHCCHQASSALPAPSPPSHIPCCCYLPRKHGAGCGPWRRGAGAAAVGCGTHRCWPAHAGVGCWWLWWPAAAAGVMVLNRCLLLQQQLVEPGTSVTVAGPPGGLRVSPRPRLCRVLLVGITPCHTQDGSVVAHKCGIVRQTRNGKLWLEGRQKRCVAYAAFGVPPWVSRGRCCNGITRTNKQAPSVLCCCATHRYIPAEEDLVVGTVTDRRGEVRRRCCPG